MVLFFPPIAFLMPGWSNYTPAVLFKRKHAALNWSSRHRLLLCVGKCRSPHLFMVLLTNVHRSLFTLALWKCFHNCCMVGDTVWQLGSGVKDYGSIDSGKWLQVTHCAICISFCLMKIHLLIPLYGSAILWSFCTFLCVCVCVHKTRIWREHERDEFIIRVFVLVFVQKA